MQLISLSFIISNYYRQWPKGSRSTGEVRGGEPFGFRNFRIMICMALVGLWGLGYLASLGNFESFCNVWVSNGTNKRCCMVAGRQSRHGLMPTLYRLSLELGKCIRRRVFCPWSQVVVQARYKDPVSGYIYRLISVALWDSVVGVGAAWMSVAGRLNGQKIRATRCTGCGAEAEAQVIPTSSRRRPASANLARSTSTQRFAIYCIQIITVQGTYLNYDHR